MRNGVDLVREMVLTHCVGRKILPVGNRQTKEKNMKYVPTLTITDARQIALVQPGQWVQLAWCDKKSRVAKYSEACITAFHWPDAEKGFRHYFRSMKAAEAFAAFNRHARLMSA